MMERVRPMPRLVVAVEMMGTMVEGSWTGHWTAYLTVESESPLWTL